MEYYLSAEKLSVGYDKKPLIENINFSIKKGEILTLIGPNGAGKSTILKNIARQLEPVGGLIFLDGQNMAQMTGNELSRKMAVVLTEKLKTEMMTCEDVVATGRYPYTGYFGILSKEDYAAVDEAMDLVHVREIKDCGFTAISDGQKQRIMLARAICQKPQIIILDEPTSYLDVKYKLEFLSILQNMRRQKGLTVIMSLHELELAKRVSDKILCVNGKSVDRFGTPEEIFVKGYIAKLFSVSAGTFDEEYESMELETPKGEPEVFVIAGAGTGRDVFRSLQRQGIPFVCGILHKNDLDYPVAEALAAKVFVAEAFEPVEKSVLEEAKRAMDQCKSVLCCRDYFGSLEDANRELFEYAGEGNKLVKCDSPRRGA